MDKIAVLVTTFNHENFIYQCLEGIENQIGNFDLTIFVYDDASTDTTLQIVDDFSQSSKHEFKIIRAENNLFKMGGKPLLGRLLPLALGFHYIAICDGDDFWIDKNKLTKQLDLLKADESIVITFGKMIGVTETGKYFDLKYQGSTKSLRSCDLRRAKPINTSTVLFKSIGGNISTLLLRMPYGDLALWSHLGAYGRGVAVSESVLAAYRVHSNSTLSNFTKKETYINDMVNYFILFAHNLKRKYFLDSIICLNIVMRNFLRFVLK